MIPQGTPEEVELFGRISLFIANSTNLELEDKAASNKAGSYFLNYAAWSGLTSFLGCFFLLRKRRFSAKTKMIGYTLSSIFGISIGLRLSSYSTVSSYYMNLKTPLGEYARSQAKILLPSDHDINLQIENSSILNEQGENLAWAKDIYEKQKYDNLSKIVSMNYNLNNLDEKRKERMAALFENNKKNSIISTRSYQDLYNKPN